MSGSAFDYNCFRISQFAEELENKIAENNTVNEWGECFGYSPKTIEKLTKARNFIKLAGDIARDVEWLYSGDIGEDTFNKRFDEMIREF